MFCSRSLFFILYISVPLGVPVEAQAVLAPAPALLLSGSIDDERQEPQLLCICPLCSPLDKPARLTRDPTRSAAWFAPTLPLRRVRKVRYLQGAHTHRLYHHPTWGSGFGLCHFPSSAPPLGSSAAHRPAPSHSHFPQGPDVPGWQILKRVSTLQLQSLTGSQLPSFPISASWPLE